MAATVGNWHGSRGMKRCVECTKPIDSRATRCSRCEGLRRRSPRTMFCRCGKQLGKNAFYENGKRCRKCAASTISGRKRRSKLMTQMHEERDFRRKMLRAGVLNLRKGNPAVTLKRRSAPYRDSYAKLRKRVGAPEAKRRFARILAPMPTRLMSILAEDPARHFHLRELIERMWPEPDVQPISADGMIKGYVYYFRRAAVPIYNVHGKGYSLTAAQ